LGISVSVASIPLSLGRELALQGVERRLLASGFELVAGHPAAKRDQRSVAHHIDAGRAASQQAPGGDLQPRRDAVTGLEVAKRADRRQGAVAPRRRRMALRGLDRFVEVVERLAVDLRTAPYRQLVSQRA
jgi:hypothetical protein